MELIPIIDILKGMKKGNIFSYILLFIVGKFILGGSVMKRITITMILVALGLGMFAGCASKGTLKNTLTGLETVVKDAVTDMAITEVKTAIYGEPTKRYVVNKGDNLWDIAGRTNVYDDSFKWVLIYKSNRDSISDPDVIEIDQEFEIKHDYSIFETNAAVQQAKDWPPYKK